MALAGSILIAGLTTSFLQSVTENPDIPSSVACVDGLRTALAVLALVRLPGLLVARAIPKTPK